MDHNSYSIPPIHTCTGGLAYLTNCHASLFAASRYHTIRVALTMGKHLGKHSTSGIAEMGKKLWRQSSTANQKNARYVHPYIHGMKMTPTFITGTTQTILRS